MKVTVAKTMKVTVKNLVISHRTIEIPVACPKCGTDLTKDGAVVAAEFLGVTYRGQFDADGNFEPDDQGFKYGDGDQLEGIAFTCRGCTRFVARGEEIITNTNVDFATFAAAPLAEQIIAEATALLRRARDLFKLAECPQTVGRVRLALTSAGGALRAAEHRKYRDKRRNERTAKRAS